LLLALYEAISLAIQMHNLINFHSLQCLFFPDRISENMAHIGLICVPATGHLNPMITLGYELKKRGHQVTVVNLLDAFWMLRKK